MNRKVKLILVALSNGHPIFQRCLVPAHVSGGLVFGSGSSAFVPVPQCFRQSLMQRAQIEASAPANEKLLEIW